MDPTVLPAAFAARLKDAMLACGHQSQRSTSGVCIHKLAEISGHSVQICRKYLRGETIPDPSKVLEIALKLGVAPGWLLFGELAGTFQIPPNSLVIDKTVLHHVFRRAVALCAVAPPSMNIPLFLSDLVNDLANLEVEDSQSERIVDIAFSSAKYFNVPLPAEA
ncbi:putative transcriptional regulator [Legionella geestiana]|uniref:Putative transcriptional regulator n=2 Tax=Legionella geestiana TaxID=45065 RepID=A0A0W0U3Q3_9GAMM|nr:helix-turn-helix transcriptional regulator [Legionella geestiana]KTD02342.1 putative transcriptional regulator [Legionella geestiana]QBS12183.1 XRE family transcriptional regulator [Legionella geestiana]QDQ40103.1 helix-turn-helix transcriptional regulator [Legionella geestiana]STX53088.1 putative transcriptional regulator [Legionella geestiana]